MTMDRFELKTLIEQIREGLTNHSRGPTADRDRALVGLFDQIEALERKFDQLPPSQSNDA